MTCKTFELRDRATFVPALAVRLDPSNEADEYLLRRAGYNQPNGHVLLMGLAGGLDKVTCDPFDWGNNRTRHICHLYILEHFDTLESGQVIDAEFINGESKQPKVSERLA